MLIILLKSYYLVCERILRNFIYPESGLGSNETTVALKALENLCEEGLKGEEIFENILTENIYLQILNGLKQIQRSNNLEYNPIIIGNPIDVLTSLFIL